MPLLKREVWFADLFLCLSLTESILILQNRLTSHSSLICKKSKTCRGLNTRDWKPHWQTLPFTAWLAAFIYMEKEIHQVGFLLLIKCALSKWWWFILSKAPWEICLLAAAGNSCLSAGSSSWGGSRGFQGTAWPPSTGLLLSRQPCGWTACVPELMVRSGQAERQTVAFFQSLPADPTHAGSVAQAVCAQSATKEEGEPACLDC